LEIEEVHGLSLKRGLVIKFFKAGGLAKQQNPTPAPTSIKAKVSTSTTARPTAPAPHQNRNMPDHENAAPRFTTNLGLKRAVLLGTFSTAIMGGRGTHNIRIFSDVTDQPVTNDQCVVLSKSGNSSFINVAREARQWYMREGRSVPTWMKDI